DAAGRMQYQEIGSLAVLEHGKLVGILTERDLARALADGVDPAETPVAAYMTEEPVTVTPEADAASVAATMLDLGVRHIPVVEGGQVIGMVSSRDLLSLEAWNAIGVT
ncbi:MAG TPA: CBS domain-containing protein, partial [Actinomycetota bacterium]